jgi:hypothetical protein
MRCGGGHPVDHGHAHTGESPLGVPRLSAAKPCDVHPTACAAVLRAHRARLAEHDVDDAAGTTRTCARIIPFVCLLAAQEYPVRALVRRHLSRAVPAHCGLPLPLCTAEVSGKTLW